MRDWRARAGRGWNPEDASGRIWHGRADVKTLVSTKVSSWTDLTSNARHATQGTDAARWVYNASNSNFNNKPTLDATGVNIMATTAWSVIAQPIVYTAVVRFSSISSKALLDNVTGHNLIQCTNTTTVQIYDGVKILDSTVPSNKMLNTNILTVVFAGASSKVYVNSVLKNTGDAGTNGSEGLLIGEFGQLHLNQFQGSLAELMVQNHTGDLPALWSYYSQYYGIALT